MSSSSTRPACCSPVVLINDRTTDQQLQLQLSVLSYAAAHGISMVANDPSVLLVHAPVTLLPTSVHRAAYESVVRLSPLWNKLVDAISRDSKYILRQLESSAKADAWLARLIGVYKRLQDEGCDNTQPIRLGVLRSDYMIHVDEESSSSSSSASSSRSLSCTAQQIELNTIAASFAGLSSRVAGMHAFMLERELSWSHAEVIDRCPINDAVQRIVDAFGVAFNLYKKSMLDPLDPSLCVMMVVQPGESNAVDQRIFEYALWSQYRIPLIRRSLIDIFNNSSFDSRGQLRMDASHTVAIVYFRAGYTPRDYPTDAEYDSIYIIEKSVAIKCPSLSVHFAGTKKIQQVLAVKGELERFVSIDEAKEMRGCFAGLYPLEEDDQETLALISTVLSHPSSYVLKPQREGGGNNLWGADMTDALTRMSKDERAAFILMKKIEPKSAPAALLRKGEMTIVDCISELGIYSAYVADGTTMHHSTFCGHLLRTKAVGVDEGGVAAGFSCLSSVVFDK